MMVRPSHIATAGRMLMEGCIAEARKAIGLEQIILRVSTSSSSAIRLYEHAGFKSCGVVLTPCAWLMALAKVRYFDKVTMVLMPEASALFRLSGLFRAPIGQAVGLSFAGVTCVPLHPAPIHCMC